MPLRCLIRFGTTAACLAVVLSFASCSGLLGSAGVLSGRLINSVTQTGIAGVAITLSPVLEGVEIVSGEDGSYAQALPAGVYAVTFERDGFETVLETVSILAGQTAVVDVELVPTAPVIVTASVEGEAVPGAVLALSAAVTVLDGSTIQSYSWAPSNSVAVSIDDANRQDASVTLPAVQAYKAELISVLREPPISEDQLPPNVPLPEGEFPGGLQDRFQVLGLNPFALEEAGLVSLAATVTTTSGSYTGHVEVHTELPWRSAAGIRNVSIDQPVLLHGKTQGQYDWVLSGPAGSSASLVDGDSQSPYFTPDVSGAYTITVTDDTVEPPEPVTLELYAGTWQGVITGQDANGRPLAENCTTCHNGSIAADQFTPWAQTGHAEIFTNNLDTSTHYGENCFACHTVGYDPLAANDGFDDASDYQGFLDAGLINNPGDNWTTMLASLPDSAGLANIQCENCHGPQNGGAHTSGASRLSLASDVCATCHGEPLRHARYQQWQLSGHANYELAIEEGESGNCSRCHTVNGFLAWLPILLDDDPSTDPLDNIEVTWTADDTHPQTCVACHDPHSPGTTSGRDSDATVRISGDTPPLIGGFTAFGVGRGAICMTCHNSRRGLRNDDTFVDFVGTPEAARAPHGSSQSDVLMGQNAYFVETGVRGSHSLVEDSCVNCHMVQTPPPDLLSYQLGGTNHTFFAADTVCANCHTELLTAASVHAAYEASSQELKRLVEDGLLDLLSDLLADGNSINFGGEMTITDASELTELDFGEARGRQALTVTFADGSTLGPFRMNDVTVMRGALEEGELYDFADDRLIKAGWNWNLAHNDGSGAVHNPPFVFELLDAAIDELNNLVDEP